MKPSNNIPKFVLGVSIGIFIIASTANAQACNCTAETPAVQSEKPSVLKFIGEDNYSHFLNIHDLSRYSNIRYEGLAMNSSKIDLYKLTSHNEWIDLDASYSKNGDLIEGFLILKDSRLPKRIRTYLVNDGLKEWTMIHNKTIVTDFDPLQTEYEVVLQRGDAKQILYFDHTGSRIEELASN